MGPTIPGWNNKGPVLFPYQLGITVSLKEVAPNEPPGKDGSWGRGA